MSRRNKVSFIRALTFIKRSSTNKYNVNNDEDEADDAITTTSLIQDGLGSVERVALPVITGAGEFCKITDSPLKILKAKPIRNRTEHLCTVNK
ncbi:hypothetical protein ACF0H5_004097 [Mactra antiquata]